MQLKIKVTTQAKHDSIEKTEKGLNVSVRAKPENNIANDRVREMLSIHFEVPLNKVKIVRGHKMSSKVVSVLNES